MSRERAVLRHSRRSWCRWAAYRWCDLILLECLPFHSSVLTCFHRTDSDFWEWPRKSLASLYYYLRACILPLRQAPLWISKTLNKRKRFLARLPRIIILADQRLAAVRSLIV